MSYEPEVDYSVCDVIEQALVDKREELEKQIRNWEHRWILAKEMLKKELFNKTRLKVMKQMVELGEFNYEH